VLAPKEVAILTRQFLPHFFRGWASSFRSLTEAVESNHLLSGWVGRGKKQVGNCQKKGRAVAKKLHCVLRLRR